MSIKFISHLAKVQAQIRDGRKRNVAAAGQAWRSAVVKVLTGPRSGRFYYVPGTRTTYQASAKGEPPASATGRLRTSIEAREDGDSYIVGTPVIYGLYLERGTSKMDPRKFLKPGFDNARSQIESLLQTEIK